MVIRVTPFRDVSAGSNPSPGTPAKAGQSTGGCSSNQPRRSPPPQPIRGACNRATRSTPRSSTRSCTCPPRSSARRSRHSRSGTSCVGGGSACQAAKPSPGRWESRPSTPRKSWSGPTTNRSRRSPGDGSPATRPSGCTSWQKRNRTCRRNPAGIRPNLGSGTLGPVGSRIVAETIIGLISEDRFSFLRIEPNWTPDYGRTTTKGRVFEMRDLITKAHEA